MDSRIFIGCCELQSVIFIIDFIARIVQALVINSSFKLASVVFHHTTANFQASPYFLALGVISGSSPTESTISPTSLPTFFWRMGCETRIWVVSVFVAITHGEIEIKLHLCFGPTIVEVIRMTADNTDRADCIQL